MESLPQPMDIEYEIIIKSNQLDSTKINKKFNVKYKNEFMSYDEEVNAKIGFLDTGENIQYFISDSKILKTKFNYCNKSRLFKYHRYFRG